jgi:hypothetical protein
MKRQNQMIAQWRNDFQAETWQEKRNRLTKFGADKLLFEEIWGTAKSSEERWKNLEAIADAVRSLQQEIEDSIT